MSTASERSTKSSSSKAQKKLKEHSFSCFSSLLERCEELYRAEDFDGCISLIDKFNGFVTDEERAKLSFFRGKIQMKLEYYDEAELIFQSLLGSQQNEKRLFYSLGIIAKRTQRPNDALLLFKKSLRYAESKASKTKINIQLGSCSLLMNDLSASEKYFKLAQSTSPCPRTHACLAWLHLKKSAFDKAIEQIAACKTSQENNSSFYSKLKYLLGLCFTHKKRYVDALEVLSTGKNFHSLCLSGVIYARVGQLPDAILFFEEALNAGYKRWEAYHNLNIAYQNSGNCAESTKFRKLSVEYGGRQDIHEFVIPELDIADFVLEESTNSISYLRVKEEMKTTQSSSGISVQCPSEDTDISRLPMTPLIGLPFTPVSSGMKVTLEFMTNIFNLCQRLGKKATCDSDYSQETSDLDLHSPIEMLPAKRKLSEATLFKPNKKIKH